MSKIIVSMIFRFAVPVVENILIDIAKGLAKKTESNIDDDIVKKLEVIVGIKKE